MRRPKLLVLASESLAWTKVSHQSNTESYAYLKEEGTMSTRQDLLIKAISMMKKRVVPSRVRYGPTSLPSKYLRFCGNEFQNDAYYLASAQEEANRLVEYCGLTLNTRVLDVGCGTGRLPIGILDRVGETQAYRGVDVGRRSIYWCQRYLQRQHPTFQFLHLDLYHPHYNPNGIPLDSRFRFPFNNEAFHIIYLYSVFSHMSQEEVRFYLKEFQRMLSPNGMVFLTAFIEEDVPDMSVNPEGYRMRWNQELHCVRYDRTFFTTLLAESGFCIVRFEYEQATDGQSALYLSPKG